MADLTQSLAVTQAWVDVSTGLGFVDGKNYFVSLVSADKAATLWWAETDSADAPTAAVIGHPVLPSDTRRGVDSRIHNQRTGVYLWVRIDRGLGAAISVTEAGA